MQNLGPDTVYYGNRSVSSTSNLGSISAAGTETGLASGLHFMASGRAMLLVSSDAAVFSVTPEQFGAVGDGVALSDVSISSGSNVLTSPSGPFVPGDVGKIIAVTGAGTGSRLAVRGSRSPGTRARRRPR